ncbi:MAG: exopolysaccharide biosynthesis protein [Acidimicrobiales bacterium]|nr:exopolysaccharide biosynthesis protein [Acidimicrobiales bacterium]
MAAILERRRERLRLRKAARQQVSAGLEAWLDTDDPTLGSLVHTFGEKVLAAACLVLMAPSALPIPTGGATHLFDVIALVFAVQLAIGRTAVWLPEKWQRRPIGPKSAKGIRAVITFVRWCEKISTRRLGRLMGSRSGGVVLGIVMVVFVVGAFVSPPFSGLDTLPSLGVVLLALAILLEDAAFAVAGLVVGVGGVGLTLSLGMRAAHLF